MVENYLIIVIWLFIIINLLFIFVLALFFIIDIYFVAEVRLFNAILINYTFGFIVLGLIMEKEVCS